MDNNISITLWSYVHGPWTTLVTFNTTNNNNNNNNNFFWEKATKPIVPGSFMSHLLQPLGSVRHVLMLVHVGRPLSCT